MSCVSLLLFLEQCLFIYKHLPYPKKTIVIWISGVSPIIATMACFGLWIPRAVMITDMTSACYFSVVVYKILGLLIEEFGGSTPFLKIFAGKNFKISVGPCCCCCPCLPLVPMSRKMLFLLKLGSLQYAILKPVFSIISVILWRNAIYDPTNLGIRSATLWINLSVGVLTVISLWPVGIVFMNLNILLRSVKIIPKYAMYQLTFVLTQLQTSIINILAANGCIACSPPLSSQYRGFMLSQKMLIMEMFIISLFTRYLYRRLYDPVEIEEQEIVLNHKAIVQAPLEEHDV
ncbi:organic solute transporter subunit alpha-like isoform X2 [Cyprinodon tularosa]|nr:organic solute transporter subunit alpha-like isoform X2 [Cyprinodon tularosa]